MSKIHFYPTGTFVDQKKYNQKKSIMTNIIKHRNAAPAPLGSVLDQLFPKNVTSLLEDAFWGYGSSPMSSIPPVNIRETAEGYDLEMSAPGLRKSDFQLKIEGDTLTISFEHQASQQKETDVSDSQSIQKKEYTTSRWVR